MNPRRKPETRHDTQRAVRAILAATVARRAGEPTFDTMGNEQRSRIKGTTEELGEIIPGPPRRAEPRDDDERDDTQVHIDDGEEIGRRDRR